MFQDFLISKTTKNKELKYIYSLIHKLGPITTAELIEKTSIKKTTLVRMIDELLKRKFIKESGNKETNVGRPPILYDIEPSLNYIVGIHISRMKTNIVLLDLRFNIKDQESFVMTTMHTPEFVMKRIQTIIQRFLDEHHINMKRLLGIGVATIGPLDRSKGIILKPESFLAANWENVPIVNMIQNAFPANVLLEKAANTAAIAEYQWINGEYENLLFCISGGWGMDCGVIIQGSVLQDQFADGAGYGHMIIDFDGNQCICGKRGCVISYTSFKSIIDHLKKHHLIADMGEEVFQMASLTDMMEFFMQGDQHIQNAILRSASYLGIGLSNLVNLFQPELVILNGPFIYNMENYYNQVIKSTKKRIQNPEQVNFTQGALKENAAAIGAGILIFNSLLGPTTFS